MFCSFCSMSMFCEFSVGKEKGKNIPSKHSKSIFAWFSLHKECILCFPATDNCVSAKIKTTFSCTIAYPGEKRRRASITWHDRGSRKVLKGGISHALLERVVKDLFTLQGQCFPSASPIPSGWSSSLLVLYSGVTGS